MFFVVDSVQVPAKVVEAFGDPELNHSCDSDDASVHKTFSTTVGRGQGAGVIPISHRIGIAMYAKIVFSMT